MHAYGNGMCGFSGGTNGTNAGGSNFSYSRERGPSDEDGDYVRCGRQEPAAATNEQMPTTVVGAYMPEQMEISDAAETGSVTMDQSPERARQIGRAYHQPEAEAELSFFSLQAAAPSLQIYRAVTLASLPMVFLPSSNNPNALPLSVVVILE